MAGFPFREKTARVLALARRQPCTCQAGQPGTCLSCEARELLGYLPAARLAAVVPFPPRPRPPFLAHRAGPVITCLDSSGRPGRPVPVLARQACADCGAELERSTPRSGFFFPEGTTLYAQVGRLTIGPELALTLLGATAMTCAEHDSRSASVTGLGFGRMRFVALLRVSTAGQARDGYGLDTQEQDIRAWGKRHKHRIAYVVKESVPGDTAPCDRPALAEALQLLSAGKVDGIVVGRLDRLARDLILQEQLIAEVDVLGGVLRSAAPAEDDHLLDNDPQRVLVRQILGAIAQYDRAMIRLRLANGLRLKASRGGYTGGAPPFGWTARGRQLVPVPAEQEIRRRIKDWRRQGWSLRKIAAKLNDEGIPTKKGHLWQPNSVARVLANSMRAIQQGPSQVRPSDEMKAG